MRRSWLFERVRYCRPSGECFGTEYRLFGGVIEVDVAPELGGLPGEAARHYFMRTFSLFVWRWYFSLDILVFPYFTRCRRTENGDMVYFR